MSVVCVTRGGHRVNIREVTFRPGFSIWSMASCAKIKFCIDRRESFPLSASHVTSSVLPFFFFFYVRFRSFSQNLLEEEEGAKSLLCKT